MKPTKQNKFFLGHYQYLKTKNPDSRQPLWRLRDGRVVNLMDVVVDLKEFKKV